MKYLYNISFLLFFSLSVIGQPFKIGQKVPEISLKNTEGTEVKLSSLHGKMVLIDFWAAWCAPCRKENPVLVKTFHKYKNESFENGEGFTIYSVSMDMKKELWLNAIERDKLVWPYHVSDLKGWNSVAATKYKVNSIPYSILIDGDGVIVALNPRGAQLEKELRKLKDRKVKVLFE